MSYYNESYERTQPSARAQPSSTTSPRSLATTASRNLAARNGTASQLNRDAATLAEIFRNGTLSDDDRNILNTLENLARKSRQLSILERAIELGILDGAQMSQMTGQEKLQFVADLRRRHAITCATVYYRFLDPAQASDMSTEDLEGLVLLRQAMAPVQTAR